MVNQELRTKDWERKRVRYAASTSLGVGRDNIVFSVELFGSMRRRGKD